MARKMEKLKRCLHQKKENIVKKEPRFTCKVLEIFYFTVFS